MKPKLDINDKVKVELKDKWNKNSQLSSHKPADFYYFLGLDNEGNYLLSVLGKPDQIQVFQKVYYNIILFEKHK